MMRTYKGHCVNPADENFISRIFQYPFADLTYTRNDCTEFANESSSLI